MPKLKPHLLLMVSLLPATAFGQITIQSTPWPTSSDPTTFGALWPGGVIAIVATGLSVAKPVVRAHGSKLPLELAGIRVKVGIGPYLCPSTGYQTNPNSAGLDAPIVEVADHGDYQQVTVQVPWEYVPYPVLSGFVCQGGSQVSVTQSGTVATSPINGYALSPSFLLDTDGYVLAQHASDYPG